MAVDVEHELEQLRAAAERIGVNLLELETDPTWALLGAASLEGESAPRWEASRTRLAELFAGYAQLAELLVRATRLRGSRPTIPVARAAELAELILGSSVEASIAAVPLTDRDLLSGTRVVQRCTPDELIRRMASSFDLVKQVLVDARYAFDVAVPQLRGVRQRLTELADLASDPGIGPPAGWSELQERYARLAGSALSDPLSLEPDRVTRLEEELVTAWSEIEARRALRDDAAEVLATARALLVGLTEEIVQGAELHRQVVAKIRAPEVPQPLALDAEVGGRLEWIAELSRDGRWAVVHDELARWQAQVANLLAQAQAVASAMSGLLEARRELRGRLDAYLGKAAAIGRLEDPELASAFERARLELYTSPTDLPRARELVTQYQRALSRTADAQGVPR